MVLLAAEGLNERLVPRQVGHNAHLDLGVVGGHQVYYEVYITLTITLFGVVESVERLIIFVFDYRQGANRFTEHRKLQDL